MGGLYAAQSGELEAVAAAIAEQYNPISQTRPGLALALADRLDSLAGLFAAGLAPKGSNDPFALRRAAIQVIENLVGNQQRFDLRAGLEAALKLLPLTGSPGTVAEVLAFVNGRMETFLQEQGFRTSVVRAVLGELGHDPYAAALAAEALDEAIQQADWPPLLDAYARCVRITRGQPALPYRPEALAAPEEIALAQALAAVPGDRTVTALVDALRQLEPPISRFFESILVMDEDPATRQNRLALLQQVANLALGIADLTQLEGF
jgi:glycyl-tRNA synthetase